VQEDLPVQDLQTRTLTEEELQEGVNALEEVEAKSEEEMIKPWVPPNPAVDKFDWIQLKSGEWLKGRIERLRDDDFEFDSDELDLQVFDWKDIRQLRSPRRHVYRFGQDLVVRGPAVMRGDTLDVVVDGEKRSFLRKDLTAIVHGADREWDNWSGNINLSANIRSGNTDQIDFSTQSWIRRETARNRVRVDLDAQYGVLNSDKTTDSVRINTKWDLYWSRDFYITVINFEMYRDEFVNISRRLTPSTGLGYHVFRGKRSLEVEFLVGLQQIEFVSVGEDDDMDDINGSLTFGIISEIELTSKIDLDTSYRINLTLPDIGGTSHAFVSTLSIELLGGTIFGDLDLDIGFNFDRIEEPRADDKGDVPEKNDYRLTIGLGLEF